MLLYWIWLAESRLTATQKRLLLEYFRDPEEIYYCDEAAFRRVPGMTDAMHRALENKDLSQAQKILDACRTKNIRLLAFGDEAYPARLRSLSDAPVLLYYRGTLPQWADRPIIGIVGTRKATPYGCTTALRFGAQIAACGGLVVSGGAAGIDTMAMQGALDMGCGVVGVLGCGVDVVYPTKNRQLFERVQRSGCLISEYPPGAQALAWHFPQRNRIISGISNGILVVEAPQSSGALNTARHALEQGRDVYSVPGNVDVPSCVGTNLLLREGAHAAMEGWDVVREYEFQYPGKLRQRRVPMAAQEELPAVAQAPRVPADKKSVDKGPDRTYSVAVKAQPALSELEKAVLSCISREGSLVDEIIAQSGQSPGTVKAALTKLALKQQVKMEPGGRVSLK